VLTKKGKSATIGKSKSSQDAATTRKQVKFLKDGTETKDKQRNVRGTKPAERLSVSDSEGEEDTGDLDEEEVDDQTEALLKGFESEGDDEKALQNKDYEAGQKIPKLDKKTKNQAKAARDASTSDKPGVIYVGRIPHGFYEQEMRQYFSQFGDISNLRLSRNRKTGSSKHFAFIEFESAEVAEIVSKTMDNYLLFGHILKCKMVAPEQVHQNLWEGANKRFKKVPWNKMEGRKLKQGMTEEAWNKRVEKEEERRAKKKEALKSMGYEFESPKVKSAKEAAKKKEQSLIATADGKPTPEETKAIEAPHLGDDHAFGMETAESGKNKKNKKNKKKFCADDAVEMVSKHASHTQDPPVMDETPNKQESNDKKSKKATRELDGSVHNVEPLSDKNADAVEGDKVAKVKKSRKVKAL
jgi:nucleolar protein 15